LISFELVDIAEFRIIPLEGLVGDGVAVEVRKDAFLVDRHRETSAADEELCVEELVEVDDVDHLGGVIEHWIAGVGEEVTAEGVATADEETLAPEIAEDLEVFVV
jgi:hypothetical protein